MSPGIKRSSRSQQIASKTGPGVHHTSPLKPRDKCKNRRVVPIDARIEYLRARLDALRDASLANKNMEMSDPRSAPNSPPPPSFTPSTSAAEANNRRRASWDVLLPHLKDPLAEFRFPSHGQTKRKKPIVPESDSEEDDNDDIPLAKRPKATLDYIAVPPQFVQGSSKGTQGAQGSAAKHRIDRRGVPAPPSAPPPAPAPASSAAPPPVDTAAIAAAIAATLTAIPPEALAAFAILLLAAVPPEGFATLATLLSAPK